MDVDKFQSTGLAYINFREHHKAVDCQRFFQGFTTWPGRHHSERTCRAQWSSIQGYEANIEKQMKQNWWKCNLPEDCKPMVFDETGARLPTLDVFPPSEGSDDERGSSSWTKKWYGGSSMLREVDRTERHPGWSNEWRNEEWWQRSEDAQDNYSTSNWRDRNTWENPASSWKSAPRLQRI